MKKERREKKEIKEKKLFPDQIKSCSKWLLRRKSFLWVPHLRESNIVLLQEISFLRPWGFRTGASHPMAGQRHRSRTSQTNKDAIR